MNKRNLIIYGIFLAILAVIAIAVKFLGLSPKIGLWAAVIAAAGWAIFWPRW